MHLPPRTLRRFTLLAALLLTAALIFAATESRGAVLESRLGILGVVLTALLLLLTAVLTPRDPR